ncbi:protein unc-93 homolog A-like [Ciona intestinalis]
MAKCRCSRNVNIISLAFFSNFAAYMSLESMQSSLNRGIGTTALCFLYGSFVISSLLLPPLLIGRLECRKSLAISIAAYALYTFANFYPQWYTLIPAAMILGMGAGILWSTALFYIAKVGQKHAAEQGKKVNEVTAAFFGRFSAVMSMSMLVGTLFMSFLIEAMGSPDAEVLIVEGMNTTALGVVNYNTTDVTTVGENDDVVCGLYYKFNEAPKAKKVSDVVMYVLLSCYLCFNILAACLCLCLDEITGSESSKSEDRIEMNGLGEEERASTTEEEEESAFELMKSTFKLLLTDPAAALLIPMTLHYGMVQGFFRGIFTASWIACGLDFKYVSYATATYGGTMILSCYVYGKLPKYTSHLKIFLVTAIFEIGLFTVTLVWIPSNDPYSELWLYFALAVGFGICTSIFLSQLGSLYDKFFTTTKKAGMALFNVWNPLGSALAFGLSSSLYPVHMVILCMTACVVGQAFYMVAEWIAEKPKYRKCIKQNEKV